MGGEVGRTGRIWRRRNCSQNIFYENIFFSKRKKEAIYSLETFVNFPPENK